MYCKTAPSRCGVRNTGHGRGDTECYEVGSSEALITKVEHLEEPMKYQTLVHFLICIKYIYFINVGLSMSQRIKQLQNGQLAVNFLFSKKGFFPSENQRQVERNKFPFFWQFVCVDKH